MRYTLTLRRASNNTDYHTVQVRADAMNEVERNGISYFEFTNSEGEVVGRYGSREVAGWHSEDDSLPAIPFA